jgi:hypothetical protein
MEFKLLPGFFHGQSDQRDRVLSAPALFQRGRCQGDCGQPLPKFLVNGIDALDMFLVSCIEVLPRLLCRAACGEERRNILVSDNDPARRVAHAPSRQTKGPIAAGVHGAKGAGLALEKPAETGLHSPRRSIASGYCFPANLKVIYPDRVRPGVSLRSEAPPPLIYLNDLAGTI